MRREQGSILVALLWCLALLSIVVIGVLHTSRMDLLVARHQADQIQARFLALAGVEKAKALLYHDSRERSRSGQNHSGRLHDDPAAFREVVFGISDEESRLNINTASAEEIARLPGMRPEIVAAIIDWRDGDDRPGDGGAEIEYYASLQPPSRPRNGPFETVRELLMVRDITPQDLLGEDAARMTAERSADDASPQTSSPRSPEIPLRGWAPFLTVDSAVANKNAAGDPRVDLQSADEADLTGIPGITSEIARGIIARRNQNRFESLADLLEVTAAPPQDPSGPGPAQGAPPGSPAIPGVRFGPQGRPVVNAAEGNSGQQPSGPPIIDETLLLDIADSVSVSGDETLPGLVNVNTAPLEVLACLPGVDRQLAHAIISYRASAGFLPNVAHLLRVPGLSREIFKQLAPRVTARSETFRILCEGRVTATGARARIQTVVRLGAYDVETLAYQEDAL
jgi:DNA uptake protein ComE-like DNA-binding protein